MTAPDAVASLLMAEIGRERPGSFFAPRPVRKHIRPSENSGMAMPLGARCPGGRVRQDF